MRKAFIDTLIEMAEKDERIFLLTGDLGFSFLEGFKQRFPGRFINMGVAEQNMIGVAAGMALSGKIVFVYSIASFVTMRCFEQIRNDLCHQKLNVRIIGVGAGVAYGTAGATHHSIEDVAIMRSLPNMEVISPGDEVETALALKHTVRHKGPVYIRLSKGGEPVVHAKRNFDIHKGIVLEDGKSIAIIVSGAMLYTAKQVSEGLKKYGIHARLISMPMIKPLDKAAITAFSKAAKAIFTIEEHGIIGGLGTAVAEVLCESGFKGLYKRFALPESYNTCMGDQKCLLKRNSLSADKVVKNILQIMDKKCSK